MTTPVEYTCQEVIRMTEAAMTGRIAMLHKGTTPVKWTPTGNNVRNRKKNTFQSIAKEK